MNHAKHITLLALSFLLLVSCCKDDDATLFGPSSATPGGWLLCQGTTGNNDADLCWFNPSNGDILAGGYAATNGQRLGDQAQDLLRYGDKMYVALSGSDCIEVVNPSTGTFIGRITMEGKQPHRLAAAAGHLYVACHHPVSIVSIDTATLALDTLAPSVAIGALRPEGLLATDSLVIACRSWDYMSNGTVTYGNSITLVGRSSMKPLTDIQVGLGPTAIQQLSGNRCAVATRQGIAIVDLDARTTMATIPIVAECLDLQGGTLYALSTDGGTAIHAIDITTLTATKLEIKGLSAVRHASLLRVVPLNGDLLVADRLGGNVCGDLYCFSAQGELRWKSEAAPNPIAIDF